MRGIIILLSLFLATSVIGQEILSVQYTNMPLSGVLEDLESKTGLRFSYSVAVVRNRYVTLSMEDTTITEILGELGRQSGLLFEQISAGQVVLRALRAEIRICGYLKNGSTGEALPAATIWVINSARGATTDENGYFEISGLVAASRLSIQYVGFSTLNISVSEISQEEDCREIFMKAEATALNEIVVLGYLTSGVNKNSDGSFTMVEEELGLFPGQVEPDVLQGIQLVPGITSLDESAAGLQVRGGSPDQNLILFDGIKMYNTGHFFGMISAFNPYVIESARIFKGGARPEYGDRISGVIDISSAEQIPDSLEGGGGLNGTHADLFLKSPLGSSAGLVLSARRSYTDLFRTPTFNALSEKVFQNSKVVTTAEGQLEEEDDDDDDDDDDEITGREEFFFYDANARVIIEPTDTDRIVISGIYTSNELDFSIADDEDIASDLFTIENKGASLKWEGSVHNKWHYRLNGYYSSFDSDYSNRVTDDLVLEEESIRRNTVEDIGAGVQLGYDLFPRHLLLAGYQFLKTDVFFRLFHNETIGEDDEGPSANYDILRSESNITHSLYSEYRWSPENNTFISAGIRASQYDFSSEYYLEPRFNAEVPVLPWLRLKGSFEKRYQPISQLVEFEDIQIRLENSIWTLSNGTDIPVLESVQISGGLLMDVQGWALDADVYHKNISGLTSFTNGFITSATNLSAGESDILGLDFLLRKKLNELTIWAGYTFNTVEYRFPGVQVSAFPGNNDIAHNLHLANSYGRGNWKFSLGWNYRSGSPYTPVENFNHESGSIIYGAINSLRLPDFHRLDASLLYGFGGEKGSVRGEVGASVRNIYARRVPVSVFYRRDINPESGETELNQIRQLSLGVTPNMVLRFYF